MNKAGKLEILIAEGSYDKKVLVDAEATVTLMSMSIRVDVLSDKQLDSLPTNIL